MSKDFTVQELFATNANITLRGVHLTCLKDLVGTTEYSSVPVKSGQNMAPNFGLTELFVPERILRFLKEMVASGLNLSCSLDF